MRYAATYAFFLEGLEAAQARLGNFVNRAAQATRTGQVFDDAATGQGLLNFFLRAVDAGAITEEEAAQRTRLSRDELRGKSFAKIVEQRRAPQLEAAGRAVLTSPHAAAHALSILALFLVLASPLGAGDQGGRLRLHPDQPAHG